VITIEVRVIPRARKTECAGFRDDVLVVRVAAPPVEGAANDALIGFFTSALGIPRRAVRIVSGDHGRKKRLTLDGVTREQIRALSPA
jgi:uncharacterized protein (TIGR00251 family)